MCRYALVDLLPSPKGRGVEIYIENTIRSFQVALQQRDPAAVSALSRQLAFAAVRAVNGFLDTWTADRKRLAVDLLERAKPIVAGTPYERALRTAAQRIHLCSR